MYHSINEPPSLNEPAAIGARILIRMSTTFCTWLLLYSICCKRNGMDIVTNPRCIGFIEKLGVKWKVRPTCSRWAPSTLLRDLGRNQISDHVRPAASHEVCTVANSGSQYLDTAGVLDGSIFIRCFCGFTKNVYHEERTPP